LWLFHPRWWRRNFQDNGFALIDDAPMGLFCQSQALGARIRQFVLPLQACAGAAASQ
jgi:hypothetical protein